MRRSATITPFVRPVASAGALSLLLIGALALSARRPRLVPAHDLAGLLEQIRANHDLPGLAAAIVRGGVVIDSAVAGVRHARTADTLAFADRFHIASCTKSLTAMVAASVVNQGRLRWDSRLIEIVPELRPTAHPGYRSVTLAQLLAHAGRIPQYTQPSASRMEELRSLAGSPTAQRLAFVTQVLSRESPNIGEGDAAYSNAGYAAAAAMLERATGESWEDLVTGRIFRPLGMTGSGFGWPATATMPRQPRGHYGDGTQTVVQPIDQPFLPYALWPAGAVSSPVTDVARYAADHLNGLRGRPALLPEESYKRLHTTITGDSSGFTLGWGRRIHPRWGVMHYGAGSGGTFFVRILIVPEHDIAIVAASNSGDAATATREVLDSVLERSRANE